MSFLGFGKKRTFPETPRKPDVGEVRLPNLPRRSFPEFPQYSNEPVDESFQKPVELTRDTSFNESFQIPTRNKIEPNVFETPSFELPKRDLALSKEDHMYVGLDHYKDALAQLDHIKEKLSAADSIFNEVTRLRAEEDKELDSWKRSIQAVKEKLMDVDKKLFTP